MGKYRRGDAAIAVDIEEEPAARPATNALLAGVDDKAQRGAKRRHAVVLRAIHHRPVRARHGGVRGGVKAAGCVGRSSVKGKARVKRGRRCGSIDACVARRRIRLGQATARDDKRGGEYAAGDAVESPEVHALRPDNGTTSTRERRASSRRSARRNRRGRVPHQIGRPRTQNGRWGRQDRRSAGAR